MYLCTYVCGCVVVVACYTAGWKGENVATTEVAEVISQYPGIAEANVYGVRRCRGHEFVLPR